MTKRSAILDPGLALPRKNAAPGGSYRKILLVVIRLGIGIALLVYLAKSGIIEVRSLPRLLAAWPVSLLAIGILLLDVALMALRLSMLFRPQGLHLSLYDSLQLTLVSFFFGTFLPGSAGGDLAKLFYAARENNGRRTEIVTVVLFDRAMGLFSLLILPLLFAPLFPHLLRAVPALRILLATVAFLSICLLLAFLMALSSQAVLSRFTRWMLQFVPGGDLPERILATIRVYRRSGGILFATFALSLVANLSLIAVTALAILALNPKGLAMKMCLVVPMGFIINSLPLTPGGLGIGETAFSALFKISGLSGGAEALLCWRIWSALVGLGGLAFYLRGVKRSIFSMANLGQKHNSNDARAIPTASQAQSASIPGDQ